MISQQQLRVIIFYDWCRGSNASTTASNTTDAFGEGTVMEMKMLLWTVGVTRLDGVRNDTIRQRFGVVPISGTVREARLRWYNHALRASNDTVREPKPWGTWKAAQKSPEATFARYVNWRHHTRRADPAVKRDRR
ncbi:unnamed protein product [Heligmosomoides polygyrus]|uniref:HTH_48 domain-containing protein n=1 Tax=Heligmosomoides polygyrus TaxID=6339 RepID=A0A183GPG9_HELPZ|nr:unnamed protein product [Heligmosomoides polygyrus]